LSLSGACGWGTPGALERLNTSRTYSEQRLVSYIMSSGRQQSTSSESKSLVREEGSLFADSCSVYLSLVYGILDHEKELRNFNVRDI
jgi:hypothetical protein